MIYSFLLILITAFCIAYFLIPSIIKIADHQELFDIAGGRKQHKVPVPALGGIAIFIGFYISSILFTDINFQSEFRYSIIATLLIVLVGLKDDLVGVSAYHKLFFQILIGSLLCYSGLYFKTDISWIKLSQFHFGVNYLLTIGFMVLLMNAYNLIDGVDGLAGSLGVLGSTTFAILFWIQGNMNWSLVSFAITGSMLAFLRFNIHSAKIFMGDTGSMFLGLMIGIFSVQYLNGGQFTANTILPFLMVTSIIIIPVFDLLRVFIQRILNGKSPFFADRTHIHHVLQQAGLNSIKTCACLISLNMIIMIVSIHFLKDTSLLVAVFLILAIMFSFSYISSNLVSIKKKNVQKTPSLPLQEMTNNQN